MKALTFVFLIFCCAASWAPAPGIKPQVYHWKDIKLKKSAAFGKNVLFEGSTRDLDFLEVSGYQLKPGKAPGQLFRWHGAFGHRERWRAPCQH